MLDVNKSNEDLAAEVVLLPDGSDLEKDSGLRAVILGDIVRGIPRDPNRYAEVFELAGALKNATTWMRLACKIESVNGRRRDPGNELEPLAEEAEHMATQFVTAGSLSLSDQLLLGKLFYNLGLLNRMFRMYGIASMYQQQSAVCYFAA